MSDTRNALDKLVEDGAVGIGWLTVAFLIVLFAPVIVLLAAVGLVYRFVISVKEVFVGKSRS